MSAPDDEPSPDIFDLSQDEQDGRASANLYRRDPALACLIDEVNLHIGQVPFRGRSVCH